MDMGFSLREMQQGRAARLPVRPTQSIGKGGFELKAQDTDAWYGLIYLARIGDTIHILDCFEKDTAKTERKELHLATQRLSHVHERLREEKRNAKRKSNA